MEDAELARGGKNVDWAGAMPLLWPEGVTEKCPNADWAGAIPVLWPVPLKAGGVTEKECPNTASILGFKADWGTLRFS